MRERRERFSIGIGSHDYRAEKSQDLICQLQAGGLEKLRTRGVNGISPNPHLKAQELGALIHQRLAEKGSLASPFLLDLGSGTPSLWAAVPPL